MLRTRIRTQGFLIRLLHYSEGLEFSCFCLQGEGRGVQELRLVLACAWHWSSENHHCVNTRLFNFKLWSIGGLTKAVTISSPCSACMFESQHTLISKAPILRRFTSEVSSSVNARSLSLRAPKSETLNPKALQPL